MAAGKTDEAVEIYDEVRKADVPKQKVIEATARSDPGAQV